ncbi:glycoside hydrolase family 26 protein [Streptomyces sp. NPDC048639]|uniref:glycoside hydrolase family 26 protein n=1 Tax=Streptomyces sp. NPDC048639 TaxID=3365581 RepID=UPI003716E9AB
MLRHPRRLAVSCLGAVAVGVLLAGSAMGDPAAEPVIPETAGSVPFDENVPMTNPVPGVPWGAFLGSGPEGVAHMTAMQQWLGGSEMRVGHTYLPGQRWADIEGSPSLLEPWSRWRRSEPDRLFVLNVPMLERNEEGVPDEEVAELLERGAGGEFDRVFRTLADRLVGHGVPDTVIVLGWEMNGTTYTSRCAPNPRGWQAYWRRIVTTMRSVPGQRFRFDYAPSRGEDAIPWTECYPGDDVVDIIGMDSYDQPPGRGFDDHINQRMGLRDQVEFAREHNKPISYPEWGLFRNGDNPEYMRRMLDWIAEHPPAYHTITDYCPHGIWRCGTNPRASQVFRRQQFTGRDAREQEADCMNLHLGSWGESLLGRDDMCIRFNWPKG